MKAPYVSPPLTEFLHQKASRMRVPLSGTFELTPCCNMRCKMCYVRMEKEKQESIRPLRSAEEWISLGEKLRDRGMLYLLLTGGEPFLRPDFREILSGLHKLGLIISINSNGTMITEKEVEWLRQTPPSRINITLYGASDETYARLCNNPHGYTQVTHAIHLLREAGIAVKLNCSVTPDNVCDLEKIYAFAEQEKLIVQGTTYMFPPLRRDAALIGKNFRFSPEDAAYYSAKIESLVNGTDQFIKRVESGNLPSLPSEAEETCLDSEGEGLRCRAGKCSFWVTWEGKCMPCAMFLSENAPDIFAEDFDSVWKKIVSDTDSIRLPAKCKSCSLRDTCRACAAMVLTESGNFHTVPEYRCAMTYAYPDACRKLATELRKESHHE